MSDLERLKILLQLTAFYYILTHQYETRSGDTQVTAEIILNLGLYVCLFVCGIMWKLLDFSKTLEKDEAWPKNKNLLDFCVDPDNGECILIVFLMGLRGWKGGCSHGCDTGYSSFSKKKRQ